MHRTGVRAAGRQQQGDRPSCQTWDVLWNGPPPQVASGGREGGVAGRVASALCPVRSGGRGGPSLWQGRRSRVRWGRAAREGGSTSTSVSSPMGDWAAVRLCCSGPGSGLVAF